MTLDDALQFMMNEKKYIYNYHLENDYSDFQFISSWENNYRSWKNQNLIPIRFIKYEDLVDKTYVVFKECIEFINKLVKVESKFNKKRALNAIRTTSFDNLSKLEKKDGFIESVMSKNERKKIPFFHLGPKNDWKKMLNHQSKNQLLKVFDQNLKELNYL